MNTNHQTEPKRIQRKRTAGWLMPEGAIYVGRSSTLGNPFRIYESSPGIWGVEDTGRFCLPISGGWMRQGAAEAAVRLYEQELDVAYPPGSSVRAILAMNLRGKDLACWCPLDQPCHADVLLKLANDVHEETADVR